MSSVAGDVLAVVVDRLRASPSIGVDSASIRCDHRTPVDRDSAPAVHVIADEDVLVDGKCGDRRFDFRVVVAVRSDAGTAELDDLLVAVMARLKPGAAGMTAYPSGVRLRSPRIRYDQQDADADVHEAAISCSASYSTGDEWTIEA